MTAQGVDQDFNFIAGVERGLKRGRGEEGTALVPLGVERGRGISAGGTGWKFEEELRWREMKVIRAPEGLSRRKQNTSSWKGGGIMWTVEWLAEGRERRLQNVADTKSVGEAFCLCYGRKGSGRKRKRFKRETEPGEQRLEAAVDKSDRQTLEESSTTSPRNEENQTPRDLDGLYFYLHRPLTSSKMKCLIPINSNSTWKEMLKRRTLLEFPTIYVREELPSQLPDPFILEQDYLQNHGEDVVFMPSTGNPHVPDEPVPPPAVLDSTKLVEVLKQDLVA